MLVKSVFTTESNSRLRNIRRELVNNRIFCILVPMDLSPDRSFDYMHIGDWCCGQFALVTSLRCECQFEGIPGPWFFTRVSDTNNVQHLEIISPLNFEHCHQHDVTNISMSTSSLKPIQWKYKDQIYSFKWTKNCKYIQLRLW